MGLRPVLLNIPQRNSSTTFDAMKVDVPKGWIVSESDDMLQFCLMKSNPLTVSQSVSIQPDFTWYVHVTGRVVPRCNQLIQQLPGKVTIEGVLKGVRNAIQSAGICTSNPEEHFAQLLEERGGSVHGVDGQVAAFLDDQDEVASGGTTYSRTVRRRDCEVLCPAHTTTNLRRCPYCKKYRSQLHVMCSQKSKTSDQESHNSHTNYRFLSNAEKDERLHNLEKAKIK